MLSPDARSDPGRPQIRTPAVRLGEYGSASQGRVPLETPRLCPETSPFMWAAAFEAVCVGVETVTWLGLGTVCAFRSGTGARRT